MLKSKNECSNYNLIINLSDTYYQTDTYNSNPLNQNEPSTNSRDWLSSSTNLKEKLY